MEDIKRRCNQIINFLKLTSNKIILSGFVTFMLQLSF